MQKTLSVVNLSAIRKNAQFVRQLIQNRYFFAVVKAQAYGHGAIAVSREIEDIVNGFCVAIVDEGVELRIAGITKPILVLAPPQDNDDILKISHYNLTPSVGDIKSATLIKGANCHLALNTGMNRYGCHGKQLLKVLDILPADSIVGAYSHLYAAENAAESKKQLAAFNSLKGAINAHSKKVLYHLSASGGILRGGEYLQDGVRCGLMLYGYAPGGFVCKNLAPALKVYARLMQEVNPTGGGVGYNIADRKYGRLYTYRLGYADGFLRGVPLGEKTLCMDAFISRKNQQLMPVMTDADKTAKAWGTISYEVLCSATRRSQIVYERPTTV